LMSVAGDPFPVTLFVLPEDERRGRRLMSEILDHLRFFEEVVGPYPFRADGYKVAQTPHLGMEHQTVIAYGANFDRGAMTGGRDWGFDALHHHELAHEWWGNLVTNTDWKDMWIHEGFGTYMQSLYAEQLGGVERYRAHLGVERQGISNLAPLAPRESKSTGEIYFDSGSDIYSKGAWVLHTLRWVLGDEAFFESLKRFAYPTEAARMATDGSQVRSVTSDDFVAVAEEVSGMELDWFFEVYLRRASLPRITGERVGEVLQLRWHAPDGLPFPMPVEVEIRGRTVRVEMVDGYAEVPLPRNAEAVVDPDGRVLRANQNTGVVATP
jgi:aminopeptidase N